ncbi:hypothetical protein KP2612_000729 [Komagataella phaffii]|nr:Predicted protein [Komagataella phaffii CBS 7435]
MSRREPSIGIYPDENDSTLLTQGNGKRRRSTSSLGSNSFSKENKPVVGTLGEAERLSPLRKRAPSLGEAFTPKRLREEVAAIKKTPLGCRSSENRAAAKNGTDDTTFGLLDFSTITKNKDEPNLTHEINSKSTLTNKPLQSQESAVSLQSRSKSKLEDTKAEQALKEINKLLTDNAKMMSRILDNQELVLRYQKNIKDCLN